MSKRRNHDAAFKARVALEAPKGERTVSEVATAYEVHPTMIHQRKKAVLEGAAGILVVSRSWWKFDGGVISG
jgi:transposase-like protein